MKKFLIGAATAAVAIFTLATSAFAWQNRIEGQPASLEPGSSAGYYFWHDGSGLHLWTTDPDNVNKTYTGTITTDGQFGFVSLERPEGDDSYSQVGTNEIDFTFHTGDGIDGVNFDILGGGRVNLSLQTVDSGGTTHQINVDNIYLGAYSVHPDHNPLSVSR